MTKRKRGNYVELYVIFRDLAIIIVSAKSFGILARKLGAPQVVGEIIAGIMIGPSILGIVSETEFLMQMAEVGVVLLMFQAGLETNLKELIKIGPIALLIACAGVFVPLLGGYLLYMGFQQTSLISSDDFYTGIFMGIILAATSVSITVQVLKEMGKLKGKLGTTILSAAMIDDVIGIIILTFIIGMKDSSIQIKDVMINTGLFFIFAIAVGGISYEIFHKIDVCYPHTRRIPIAGLAYCLGLSYIAEYYFGIADLTGAYLAGIILCSIQDADYIAEKMEVNSYMIFGPIFFTSIGLQTTMNGLTKEIMWFSIAFVFVGLFTKMIGCGLVARFCSYTWKESIIIGIGMMNRGEVALIIAQKGLGIGLLIPTYFTSVILLIVVSSLATPILLKIMYKKDI
ncbi:MAG: cation:proton antiporter [Eubacteriales bacterium]